MDLMKQAPLRVCEAIDALAKRFLKECGYKIDNFKDRRQLNRVKNRMTKNNKELVHTQREGNNGSILFWFTLYDFERKEVVRESKVLKIEPLKFTVTQEDLDQLDETFTMPLEAFQEMVKGGV